MDSLKRKNGLVLLVTAATLLFSLSNALACTDFQVKANDGSIVIARTLEFGLDLKSNLMTTPRDYAFNTTSSNGQPGASWKSKYGYLYLDALNTSVVCDGMNEAGLSFEYLYLPGETQYQVVPAGHDSQALPYYYLGDWVLGNFKSVDEVRAALKNIYVIDQKIPNIGDMSFPVHASIHDASGKGIVIEFIKGHMNIYDNQVGILTNSPTYNWQISNLRNFVNLSPYVPDPIRAAGLVFAATGQGSGMLGMPGDYSPPSRFAKTALLLKAADPANTALDAVNLAEHIINNFDIAKGTVRSKNSNGPDSDDTTEWTVFKDLTHKIFYYHTYADLSLHSVDMSKIDFSKNAPRLKMSILSKPTIVDVTQQFMQQKFTSAHYKKVKAQVGS